MTRRELPAASVAVIAALVLLLLMYVGSRGLQDFDAALIGYAVASVFALAAVVFRYTPWITRPPTWRYFKAGWKNLLSWRNFRRYAALIPVAWWADIFAQTFIFKRSPQRWLMHMAIFWGVVLSCAVTFRLTFGWIRFTLVPPDQYQLWFFGFAVFQFPIQAGTGFALFHALDWSALLLIVGLAIALFRRTTSAGLLTTQRFGFDLMPIVLLFAIAVTGLALTASSMWWEGRFYWFMSLVHQVTVVGWLLSLPFGKFFHIVQRPASIGVTLYQVVNQDTRRAILQAASLGGGRSRPGPLPGPTRQMASPDLPAPGARRTHGAVGRRAAGAGPAPKRQTRAGWGGALCASSTTVNLRSPSLTPLRTDRCGSGHIRSRAREPMPTHRPRIAGMRS